MPHDLDGAIETRAQIILPGARRVGWWKIMEGGWQGHVSIFEVDGQRIYVWFTGTAGKIQADFHKGPVDSPLAAIREWLATEPEQPL